MKRPPKRPINIARVAILSRSTFREKPKKFLPIPLSLHPPLLYTRNVSISEEGRVGRERESESQSFRPCGAFLRSLGVCTLPPAVASARARERDEGDFAFYSEFVTEGDFAQLAHARDVVGLFGGGIAAAVNLDAFSLSRRV